MHDSNDYLAHYGIKGQKWGLRRYQNTDGSLTAEGRRRLGLSEKSRKDLRKAANAKKRAERKEAAAQKKVEKQAAKDLSNKENLKAYLRKHPKQAYKHATELTREDAEQLIKDIEFDRKLKDIRDSEVKRTWDQIRNLRTNAQTIADLMGTGKSLYNSMVEINNLLVDTGKSKNSRMTKLGEKAETKEDRSAIEKIIRSGSAQDVLDNSSKMTSKELEEAMKRINTEDILRKKLSETN